MAKVVDMFDHVPMEDRDTKDDLYEYILSKIASAGQNGQFCTPRHIIKLMVEMTEIWVMKVPPFLWDTERRALLLRAERDACYAKIRTDPGGAPVRARSGGVVGGDYPTVPPGLKNKETRKFGEYRTKRLVLEAWDRLFGKE